MYSKPNPTDSELGQPRNESEPATDTKSGKQPSKGTVNAKTAATGTGEINNKRSGGNSGSSNSAASNTGTDRAEGTKGGDKDQSTKGRRRFWDKKKFTKPAAETAKQKRSFSYKSRKVGSTPSRFTYAQNLDFSQFPVLVRQVYEVMCDVDPTVREMCPFPMFQHVMFSVLNAYIIDYSNQTYKNVLCPMAQPAGESIQSYNIVIPQPIADYIACIGNSLTRAGEIVGFNVPEAVLPRATAAGNVQSGTFGPCNAASHNVYECYASPYVSKRYIECSIINNNANVFTEDWQPLPQGYYPMGALPNENLVGWWPVERLSRLAVAQLMKCGFENGNSIGGRLAFSEYATDQVSRTIIGLRETIKGVPANVEFHETGAVFLTKVAKHKPDFPLTERLVDINSDIYSRECFGSSASNRANYFGFRRRRNEDMPGLCYTLNDAAIAGWVATRNHNYEMGGQFAARGQRVDLQSLRDDRYFDVCGMGYVNDALSDWLRRIMLNREGIGKKD